MADIEFVGAVVEREKSKNSEQKAEEPSASKPQKSSDAA
jgi:hypothetical protein